jgi:hypothetical protein
MNKTISILSDFCLEDEEVMNKFEDMLVQMEINNQIPGVFIICGQFIKEKTIRNAEDQKRMISKFSNFRKVLQRYKPIVERMFMILVPDINDPWLNVVPRKPLPESLISQVVEHFPNIIAAENPCNFSFLVRKIF